MPMPLSLSIPHTSTRLTNKEKAIIIKSSQMEIDDNLPLASQTDETKEGKNPPTHMEEEPESIDLGDVDILALELACHQRLTTRFPSGKLTALKSHSFVHNKATHQEFKRVTTGMEKR